MGREIGTPVAEGVGRIAGFVNAYVVRDDSGILLVDTTMSRRATPVVRAFAAANVPLSSVAVIVLTHQHLDHVGGAASLAEVTKARVACHGSDAPVIVGMVSAKIPALLRPFVRVRPVQVDSLLQDEQSIGGFRVVFAPGHTAGEIALYQPARRWLFSGDSVIERKGRLALPSARVASDPRQAVSSLAILRRLEIETLFPGHGVPVSHDVQGQLNDLFDKPPEEYTRSAQ